MMIITWWWIARPEGGELTISMFERRNSVGPYWTYTEALKMIEKWR